MEQSDGATTSMFMDVNVNGYNDSNSVTTGESPAPVDWNSDDLSRRFTIDHELYRYVSIILLSIGIPGNFLCAYLWLQRRLRTSSGVYLSALGMAEFCFLMLFIIQYSERAYQARITTNYFTCKTFVPVFYFTQYLHPLLTAAYTIERWYAVTFPFQAYKVCTIKVACIVIGCLIGFSMMIASVQLLFWQYDEASDLCDLHPDGRDKDSFLSGFYTGWSWATEMFFFAVIPLVVLIVNIVVIVITRRVAESDVMKNVARLQERKSAQGSQAAATTVTLLILSFYFICTTLPVSACSVLSLEFSEGNTSYLLTLEEIAEDPVWTSYFRFYTIRTVIQDCFGLSQYCCAFYIYVATSNPFRKVALQALARWFPCVFRRMYQQLHRKEMLELTGITCTSIKFERKPGMTRAERDAELAKVKAANASASANANSNSNSNKNTGSEKLSNNETFKARKQDGGPKTRRELDELRYSPNGRNGADHAKLLSSDA